MALSKLTLTTPLIGDHPHQPSEFAFPKREFGRQTKVKRSFQGTWFKQWSWLHYVEEKDTVFCYLCVKAYRENKLTRGTIDPSFISRGFSNWKDASVKLKAHECSNCHKEAVQKVLTLPRTTQDVGEALSSIHKQDKQQRRQVFLKILSNVRFLARQTLPLRGDGNETD